MRITPLNQAVTVLALVGAGLMLASCDRVVEEEPSRSKATSVLDSSADDAEDLDASLQALILEALSGAPREGLVQDLAQESPAVLLAALAALPTLDGPEGEKGGLAAVMVSVLAEKSPGECVRYLSSRKSAYGLHKSEGGILALRQAMEAWAQQAPDMAFARLTKLREDPDMRRVVEQIAKTHDESLQESMAAAISIDDLQAVNRVWQSLSRKEVGAVLSRHLAKASTPDERSAFIDHTADWVNQQWLKDGPQAVFDWAIGLTDDNLRAEVLDRVKLPQLAPDGTP